MPCRTRAAHERDAPSHRADQRQAAGGDIEQIVNGQTVLCGHQHALRGISGPDLGQQVDKAVRPGVAPPPVDKRLGALEQAASLVALAPEEVHALLEGGRTENDTLGQFHGVDFPGQVAEVAEVVPHQRLTLFLDAQRLDQDGIVLPARQHASVVCSPSADDPAVRATCERDHRQFLRCA